MHFGRPAGSTIRCVDAHLVLLVVLLLAAIVVVIVDVRRGKAKEQRLLATLPQPPVDEIVVEQTRVAMVVHANPVSRLTIRRLLEQQGYEVIEARDGETALAGLATPTDTARPTTVIVDSDLPEKGGGDLVRSIQADPTYGAIRILIITADAEADQAAPGQDDGAVQVQYLHKPFSSETFLAALHQETGPRPATTRD